MNTPTIRRRTVLQGAALLAASAPAAPAAAATSAPKDAFLYIISPTEGQRLRGAFVCRFGLRGMGVAPAGVAANHAGHHHLLVDVDDPIKPEEAIPADKQHIHFGAGQTETRLELPPGRHTL